MKKNLYGSLVKALDPTNCAVRPHLEFIYVAKKGQLIQTSKASNINTDSFTKKNVFVKLEEEILRFDFQKKSFSTI